MDWVEAESRRSTLNMAVNPYNRIRIFPFEMHFVLKQRIRRGQPIFGGEGISSESSSEGGWTAKEPPRTLSDIELAFKLLGLTQNAAEVDVKRSYKELAFQHHPDRGGDVKNFHEVAAAKDLCLKYIKNNGAR